MVKEKSFLEKIKTQTKTLRELKDWQINFGYLAEYQEEWVRFEVAEDLAKRLDEAREILHKVAFGKKCEKTPLQEWYDCLDKKLSEAE